MSKSECEYKWHIGGRLLAAIAGSCLLGCFGCGHRTASAQTHESGLPKAGIMQPTKENPIPPMVQQMYPAAVKLYAKKAPPNN